MHCASADLPVLDAEQWEGLCATRVGQSILDKPNAPSTTFSPGLELIVRSISPAARANLESLGYCYDAQVMLDVAAREKKRLFVALHRAQHDPEARKYVATLGFTKPVKIAAKPPYYSSHVYGKKGALCFSEGQTRIHNRATINVEGAVVLDGPSPQFDWRSKVIVQLTPEEMFLVLAVLNGRLDKVIFAGHGVAHDKMMEMHGQQNNYFVRLVQKGRVPVSVPILAMHALNLTSLLFQQIKSNHPHLSVEQMRVMEDQLVRMYGS